MYTSCLHVQTILIGSLQQLERDIPRQIKQNPENCIFYYMVTIGCCIRGFFFNFPAIDKLVMKRKTEKNLHVTYLSLDLKWLFPD